jgi:hypothetical protein
LAGGDCIMGVGRRWVEGKGLFVMRWEEGVC